MSLDNKKLTYINWKSIMMSKTELIIDLKLERLDRCPACWQIGILAKFRCAGAWREQYTSVVTQWSLHAHAQLSGQNATRPLIQSTHELNTVHTLLKRNLINILLTRLHLLLTKVNSRLWIYEYYQVFINSFILVTLCIEKQPQCRTCNPLLCNPLNFTCIVCVCILFVT